MDQEFENNNTYSYQPYDPWSVPGSPAPEPAPQLPKRKGWSAGKVIALALCCSLLSGILGAVIMGLVLMPAKNPESADASHMLQGIRENAVIDITQIDTGKSMTPAQVYANNVNSTVGITTSITTNYWGYQSTSAASGSGFILSDDGYILTNFHVIEDSDSITVTCYDGSVYDAQLIGYDASNDIAVLKVDAQGLPPVVLGDSDNMNVGDGVVAIGNPLGELTFSLTSGTVSALNRQVTMSNGSTMNLIQTDCAINSGNSGGALFNIYGEVVGITNAKYSSSSASEASIDNIGFAIPMNDVRGIVESIIEKGYISKPYIGISVSDVAPQTQLYGIPAGAAVQELTADGPAVKAGLQVGDVITQANGISVTSTSLIQMVRDSAIGDVLKLTIYRQGATLELDVTVGEQIQPALEETETTTQENGQMPQFPWENFWW